MSRLKIATIIYVCACLISILIGLIVKHGLIETMLFILGAIASFLFVSGLLYLITEFVDK